MGRRIAWAFVTVTALTGLLMLLASGALWGDPCWTCALRPGRHSHRGGSVERNAWQTLRTFVSAQMDFRGNDRDGDGRMGFWRKDVAGLYAVVPAGSTEMIKLIELSAAGADLASFGTGEVGDPGPGQVHLDRFTVPSPKAGHWFVALRFEDEIEGRLDPQRFAFCAVPDSMSAGRSVYIVSHDGVVWEAPARLARDVPRAYPTDPEKQGWRKRDGGATLSGMYVLYILLGVVAFAAVAVLVAGFTSPRVARFKKSIEIAAPPEKIFPYLNSVKRFSDEWSPWTEKDPAATHTFTGPAEGVGAKHAWEGNPKTVGQGTMEITASEPNRRVKSHLSFKGRGEADAGWILEDLGGGQSRLTWDFEADNGNNPLARIFGRLMDKFLGPDYEKGLARLKKLCES